MMNSPSGHGNDNGSPKYTTQAERREINHRVSNSLQIVTAFLRARRNDRETAEEILNKAADRISAIAHFHNYLAQEDAHAIISFTDFLQTSMGDICTSIGLSCEVRGDDIELPTGRGLSLLIVINELAINAYKHAYGNTEGGLLTVICERRPDEIVISVADAGKGLPESFSMSGSNGLGADIINSTVDQIGGRLAFRNLEQGCVFEIHLPL